MRLRVGIEGYDFSDVALVESMTIHQDSTEAISTADITLFRLYGDSYYDHALYDRAAFNYAWQVREWQEIIVWDQDSGQIQFAGLILAIQRTADGPHVHLNLRCSDWGFWFERTIVTQSWANGTADSTIVEDLVRLVPGLTNGTIVTRFAQLGLIEAKDQRIRDVLDNLCSLTGAEWNVSYDGKVNYYQSGSIVAPFGLSDEPDGTTTQPYMLDNVNSDFTDAANRILVLGGVNGSGAEIRATAVNTASENTYGTLAMTLVDRGIEDQQTATLWAQTEIALRSQPKPTLTVAVFAPGLARGMTVFVEAHKYGVATNLILRTLEIVITAPDRSRAEHAGHELKYTAVLGWRPPDSVYTLRRMQRRPVERTEPAAVEIPPGSITPPSLAAGLEMIHVVASLPPLPDPAYSATAIALWTNAPGGPQLYRRTGNTWTAYLDAADISGQLATSQFRPGSVTSTVLADGSVVTAKIPAGAITAPQLAASSVTANAIAANAIYAEAIQANSIQSQHLVANAVTAGKIAALAVVAGNLAADAVTAGTIAAGAIRATDAVFAAAAIQSADIASLTGDKITANTITSDKLSAFELSIGAGGNKPGRISLYNGSQQIVALLGDLSQTGGAAFGTYGMWGKVIAAGGNGYFDAPFYTDTFGNLFIRQANFQITAGGATIHTSPVTFDPTYGALALTNTQGADQASFVSRGVVLYNSGAVIGAFVRHPSQPNAAQLVFNRPGGGLFLCDGFTGSVRADGGYGIQGQVGQTETVVISGVTLRFAGGIYVGH